MAITPKIFDAEVNGDFPSDPSFNSVKIVLDGSLRSDLKWDAQKQLAREAIDRGYKILWEINLELFSGLPFPLHEETQARSLRLSLDVFCHEIWEAFKEESLGLCLFRGSCDFVEGFNWSAVEREHLLEFTKGGESVERLKQSPGGYHMLNLFCCSASVDYLNFICADLPDSLPLFLLLDAQEIKNPGHLAQLLSRERFERFSLILKGSGLPVQGFAWEWRAIVLKPLQNTNIAFCLPPISVVNPVVYKGFTEALLDLNRMGVHYRIIPEPFLTMEWDLLDYLIILPDAVTPLGERMLLGFCAAGGTPVTLGHKLGLPDELTFNEWTEKLLEIL